MKTLTKQAILGGNIALYIIPSNLIHPILGDTIFFSGTNPTHKLECANESILYASKIEDSRAGSLYSHSIKAFIPGNVNETIENISKLSKYPKLVAILQNSQGDFFCIGNTNEGLRLFADFDSSADPSGRNGYSIELSGKLTLMPNPIQMPLIPL